MSTRQTFLFCGGGSGGHLYPALAVVEELRVQQKDCRLIFLTTGREIEQQILNGQEIEPFPLGEASTASFRKIPLRSIVRLLQATRTARRIIRETRPDAVIGLGGFGSVPGVLAAKSLGVPVVLLEQNAIAGRANSWLIRWADVVCTSFPNTLGLKGKHIVETGNPVRHSIIAAAQSHSQNRRQLLILGGSQGAHALNAAVTTVIGDLKEVLNDWNIIHQTGPSDIAKVTRAYEALGVTAEVTSFIPDIAPVLASTELVISRAGATTLAELAIMGLPAILIPIPNSIRDHQRVNARRFSDSRASIIVDQSADRAAFSAALKSNLAMLLTDATICQSLSKNISSHARPEAAKIVARELNKLVSARNPAD